VIALDTNLLVYARREELPEHPAALALLTRLAEGDEPWALAWPCVYEFLRVITHPRVFDPPTPLGRALEDLESLLVSPSLVLLGEGPAHAGHLRRMVEGSATRSTLGSEPSVTFKGRGASMRLEKMHPWT